MLRAHPSIRDHNKAL